MRNLVLVSSLFLTAACGAQTVVVDSGGAAAQEKDTAGNVKSFATTTPPANARSMGMTSSPSAGNVTIPITNVEVYVFNANVDADTSAETLYWAATDYAVFVWGAINIECVDEAYEPTGETGVGYVVFEADAGGYGWMLSDNSCGYSTVYGCSASTGYAETCGGCDFDDQYIVCGAE
jgi:hypothetical protein